MKCPNCGKDNPPGSKFCNECGKKLPEQSLEQIWNEVQESSKKPTSILKGVPESEPTEIRKPESKFKSLLKRNKTLVCGIIGGAVVLVALLGICLSTCNCRSTVPTTTSVVATESQRATEPKTEAPTPKPTEPKTEPKTEKPTEPETEPPTPKPTEPPTEAPTSITDTLPLIFSNDEFDIYFVSAKPYEYDDTETLVKFLINNKYNTQIEFQADTIILDGISYSDIIMSDPVSANSLGYIEATVEDCSNSNPSSVGGDLSYFDKILEGTVRGDINIPSTNIK